ncbi:MULTISPECIES: hypothetical protein [Microbacterium]|uniref:hypothetical protein n=1 Tax=Microbacterium TaxID=33882 RepID=UPI0010F9F553|nr:hypothetical protein [Microbacterium sp. 4NA327F11]MCK9915095.1 hypothetical protein [Microbacteriaceae bacterium K1510]
MADDPRQVRTRAALDAALRALLRDRRLDQITVSDLCREAGVHRTTFYGHATDVLDFAMRSFAGEIDRLGTVDADAQGGDAEALAVVYTSALVDTLDAVVAERDVYRALFGGPTGAVFGGMLAQRLADRAEIALHSFTVRAVAGAPTDAAARREAAAYIGAGVAAFIRAFAGVDDRETAEAAERARALLPAWWPGTSAASDRF